MKIKLEKHDTALLMCTKNAKIKLHYDYSEYEDFQFTGEDAAFNKYREIAIVYADSRAIPLSSVRLAHVNSALLEIYAEVQPNKLLKLLKDLNYKHTNSNKDVKSVMFVELYGLLQALQMRELIDEEYIDIYDLDESLVIY